MFSHHFRCVLNGVAGLLIGAGLLQNVSGQDVPDVMRPVGQQALDRSAACVRIPNSVPLDQEPPGFVEGRLIVLSGTASIRGALDASQTETDRRTPPSPK